MSMRIPLSRSSSNTHTKIPNTKNVNKNKNKYKPSKANRKPSKINIIKLNKPNATGGGFLFDFFKQDNINNNNVPVLEYGKYMGSAINSEKDLIKSYEAYAKATQNYHKNYENHLRNIRKLEETKGLTSLTTLFKDTIIPNDFKYRVTIDRTNPLLLRNYLVTDYTLPINFKKEHVINQIRYIISKFKPSDKILIDSIGNPRIDGTTCYYTIKTSNGEKIEKLFRINDNYVIDKSEVESQVTELIANLKSRIDFNIELINDFEIGEDLVEVPGLAFADPEDILKAKLKDIKGSVKAEVPIIFQTNNKSDAKLAPKPNERVIYSVGQKSLPKRNNTSGYNRDIGANAKLNPDEFKQEPMPEIADQLKKIFNPDIQQPDMMLGQQGQYGMQQQGQYGMQGQQQGQYGMQGQQPYGMQGPPMQLQQQFPMQRNFDAPMLRPQPFLIVDPVEQQCRVLSDKPNECMNHPMCYYSAHLEPTKRCHKDVKALMPS